MNVAIDKLENLFQGILSPLQVSIFFAESEYANLKCLHSTNGAYQLHQTLSIYDVPSLLRVLSQKADILQETLVEEIYEEESEFLCYVLEWSDHARKIILFNLENAEIFEQEEFTNILRTKQENIREIYQKLYYQYMEGLTL